MEIFKYLELNDNENVIYQNLWDAVKVVFRGKCIASITFTRKEKKSENFEIVEKDKGGRMNKDKNRN